MRHKEDKAAWQVTHTYPIVEERSEGSPRFILYDGADEHRLVAAIERHGLTGRVRYVQIGGTIILIPDDDGARTILTLLDDPPRVIL